MKKHRLTIESIDFKLESFHEKETILDGQQILPWC